MSINNSNQEQFSQNEMLLRKISVNPPTSESMVRFHESIQRMSSVVLDLQRLPISRMVLATEEMQISLSRINVNLLIEAAKNNVQTMSNVGAAVSSRMAESLTSIASSQNLISDMVQMQSQLIQDSLSRIHSETMNHLISSIGVLDNTFSLISNIDFSGLENLEIDELTAEVESQQGSSDLPATITVTRPEKKLMEMTESELDDLIKKNITAAGTFSIGAFIVSLFDEYIKEIALVVMEIIFAFALTFLTGQFNAGVIEEISNRIEETDTYRDTKKVITRYVKVNPTEQVAFIRKGSYLRDGASKGAPVVSQTQITSKIVLTIIDRKNNWVKVEVNNGDSCGEIGWVQESLVVKFKKMDQ
ncbi:hypothetical protein ACFWGC_25905 [Cytobacillus pseudoceanisediminis]|uniref:hypothetical protein n=1 Tax=Cytobacillus pseudoceanisediminis TaxID=3051614 RepID=UPI00364820E2